MDAFYVCYARNTGNTEGIQSATQEETVYSYIGYITTITCLLFVYHQFSFERHKVNIFARLSINLNIRKK